MNEMQREYERRRDNEPSKLVVTLCSNREWLFRNGLLRLEDDEHLTHEEQTDAVNDWLDLVAEMIEDDDELENVEAVVATGKAATYHGWNGIKGETYGVRIDGDEEGSVVDRFTTIQAICELAAERVMGMYLSR